MRWLKTLYLQTIVSINADFLELCLKFEKLENNQVKDLNQSKLFAVTSLKELFHRTPIEMCTAFREFKKLRIMI